MFYKIANGMVPNYLREPVRFPRRILRSPDIPLIKHRTDRYLHSFYPDSLTGITLGLKLEKQKLYQSLEIPYLG